MEYIREIIESDLSVCKNAHTFLQSAMWGEFKSRFGWAAKAFLVSWQQTETQETFPLMVLCRRLAPGFSFAYIPWGPEMPESFSNDEKPEAMAQLAKKLKTFIARNTAFIRFEPPWAVGKEQRTENKEKLTVNSEQFSDNDKQFLAAGFKRAAAVVQPPDTVIVDLTASCEDILAAMKPKWRYNVSLALKKGVQVNSGGIKELEIFYQLLKETALRDGIAVHNFDYYKTLFEMCGNGTSANERDSLGEVSRAQARLYIASHVTSDGTETGEGSPLDGDFLASIFVLFRGREATYLYGASSNNKRNLMAPYALQWKAMQDAKEAGCQYYDLFGIPPNEDPNHPMAGLYRFKTGFGGQIIHRAGSWDYAYKPVIYNLFNFAEGLRKKIRDMKKNKKFLPRTNTNINKISNYKFVSVREVRQTVSKPNNKMI